MAPAHRPARSAWPRLIASLLSLSILSAATLASAATLELHGRAGNLTLEGSALAQSPEAREIEVPKDVAYGRPARYRAVPLSVVLRQMGFEASDTLEAVALDGFVAQLPGTLVLRQPGEPWLAIEPDNAPWPALPGKSSSAGPFYIVWPDNAGVGSEQWPYAVAKLNLRDAPEQRWPQVTVSPDLPADHPARRGQSVFVVQCLVCHRMNGGGEATVGPDLNLPANPTEYFQPQALRRLIRNPSSLRQWPTQIMPGFTKKELSDASLEDLVAYLEHMVQRRAAAR